MNNANGGKTVKKPIELVFHNIHEHGTEIMDLWMGEIEKRCSGAIRFKKTSGEDRAAIRAADIVRDVPAGGERYRLLNLIQVPFIFPGSVVGSRVVARLYAEFPEMRQELDDVKVLGLGTGASMAIFSSRDWGPIDSLNKMKGVRIRSLPQIDRVMETFGAKPAHIGWFDMPRLLASGDLDAAVLGVLPGHQFKLEEGPAPNCTLTGELSITMHPMRIYMTLDAWNRLPGDVRKAFDSVGPAGADCWFAVENGRDSDTSYTRALEHIKKRGKLTIIGGPEMERWRRAAQPDREAAIEAAEKAGAPGRKFFNRMLELVEQYRQS